MQFSLRVICKSTIIEAVKERVTKLTEYLCLPDDYVLSPYWKDEACVIFEICANIENPEYSKIPQYVQAISGAEILSESSKDEGEWAYFPSLDELHSDKNIAFVVCNIFESQSKESYQKEK